MALGGEEPTKFLPSEETRKIYIKRIKGFWDDYRRNKIGLVGIAILVFFVLVAFFGPWLTPYHPTQDRYLAIGTAMPQWITAFSQFKDLPPSTSIPANWQVEQGSDSVYVNLGEITTVRYNGTEKSDIYLRSIFWYPYLCPPNLKLKYTFNYEFAWETPVSNQTGYSLELILTTWDGRYYSLGDSYYGHRKKLESEIPLLTEETNSTLYVRSHSYDVDFWARVGWSIASITSEVPSLAHKIFNEKGEYYLQMHIVFEPVPENATNPTCEIDLKKTIIGIPGQIHGLLGADQSGSDIFSQLVYSTRTSLMIGLLTGVITTAIGIIVGVTAGYVGGIVDEILMRIVDVSLCIPMLPIIITLAYMFGPSVWNIIFLIAMLWWTGLARIIRSRVLSLREMDFIESAKAVGAGRLYIIFRHIVPNVLPIAFAAMILNVPSAIIMEAVVSFIGLTPIHEPTWGRMLNDAQRAGAFRLFAWWWIIPPGLALMTLSLAFVFIGNAVDEIVNPRLRRRR